MSEEAILIFSHHPENENTRTYTFSSNETIPANIILEFQNGAMLHIDANVTINIFTGKYKCHFKTAD